MTSSGDVTDVVLTRGWLRNVLRFQHEDSTEGADCEPILKILNVWRVGGRVGFEITDGESIWPGCRCPKTMLQSVSDLLRVGAVIQFLAFSLSPHKIIELRDFRLIHSGSTQQKKTSSELDASFHLVRTEDDQFKRMRKDANPNEMHESNSTNSFEWQSLNNSDLANCVVKCGPCDNICFLQQAEKWCKNALWTIRVRVRHKSPMIPYVKGLTHGIRFTFDVFDSTGEIRIIGFNARCVRFFPLIHQGGFYRISRGNVQLANKRFNNLNNPYEIVLTNESIIVSCDEQDEDDLSQINSQLMIREDFNRDFNFCNS